MDITQIRQIGQDILPFVSAVQWDARTPIQLLGTGSQQAQQYPSDIDLFSGIKETARDDVREIYSHLTSIFENANMVGDMYFIEFKLQNLDGSKQKWFNTEFSESDLADAVPTGATIDFVKVDYVIFIRDRNLFTELSSIYSFSRMPPIRQLVEKIGGDFYGYFSDGNYYKSLKRMYSIYRLKGKKAKLVELSTLFNSSTGFKYSISSNLKAIKLLLEHYSDISLVNAVRANLSDIGNVIGEKITTEQKMDEIISALDSQIQKETVEWLGTHSSVLPPDTRLTGGINAPFGRMGGKRKLAVRLIKMFPKDYKIYVEPFVGAGNIFFRVPRQEGVKYVLNDKDTTVYKILKALRDRGDKINRDLKREKPSRETFNAIRDKKTPRTAEEELILSKHSFYGSRKSYIPQAPPIKTDYSKHFEALKGVTILNEDFAKVIRSYNTPATFFYLDPPYESKEMRDYADYVTPEQVYDAVKTIKGKFMLSYNDSPNIRRVFAEYNIKGITTSYTPTPQKPAGIAREVVITNY